MDTKKIMEIFANTAYVRTGGSDEELRCAQYIAGLCRELTGREPDMAALQARRDEALRRFRGEENPYIRYCALLAESYGTDMTARQIYDRRYAIAQGLLETLDYKPGADRFLWALKDMGLRLILVTTTRRRSVDTYRTRNGNIINKAPLDRLFEDIYTGEDAKNIKPDPADGGAVRGVRGLPGGGAGRQGGGDRHRGGVRPVFRRRPGGHRRAGGLADGGLRRSLGGPGKGIAAGTGTGYIFRGFCTAFCLWKNERTSGYGSCSRRTAR